MGPKCKKWARPTVPEFLTALPGEIRNQIFEYCIFEALNRAQVKKLRPHTGDVLIPKTNFTITALPLWSGPSTIRMNSMGSLPLLFANRQIYVELSSLLYSKVDQLCMGGYMLQRRGEDPNIRWNAIYPLLEKRINLHKFVKTIKISLPSPRDDLSQGHWRSLGFIKAPIPEANEECRPWVIVPGLVKYLGTFPQLSNLQVVISMDQPQPPNFDDIIPLWDICGEKTVVTMKSPTYPGFRDWTMQWHANWERAWSLCLLKHGRITRDGSS